MPLDVAPPKTGKVAADGVEAEADVGLVASIVTILFSIPALVGA